MSEQQSPEGTRERDVFLSLEGLKKHYIQDDGFLEQLIGKKKAVKAVDGVDLEIYRGETLGIVGESGCGKSTLARTLLRLEEATEGSIYYKDEDLVTLSDREMRPHRKDLQMIFQDPVASLNPRKRVGKILTTPLEIHGIGDSNEERVEIAKDLLERVGLDESHIHRYPHQFSGGQQQRIGIARAISVEPDLLVADEPVSALDVSIQAQILQLLKELQAEYGLSLVVIAHNLSVVRHIADRVAVMYLGKIVETGPVEELFTNPQHPYTKSLLSSVPRINPDDRGDRIILEGTTPSPINPPTGCRFHTRCPSVIPSEDWDWDHQTFLHAFTFRIRLVSKNIDESAIRKRLEREDQVVTDESVISYIIESFLPTAIDDLPSPVADIVYEATEAYLHGDESRAEQLLEEQFDTPCMNEKPELIDYDSERRVACHHVDPSFEQEYDRIQMI